MEPRDAGDDNWLDGIGPGSEMAERVRAFDWASTPLGPIEGWSLGLRTAVRLCLASDFAMLVVWGPDLIKIYNDRYVDILGAEKHPAALGRPAREVWPEIWDEIGPMFASVTASGVPTFVDHGRLVIDRSGFPEECFFTWSYSAIYDDDGTLGGVLDVVTETTHQVLAERRLATVAGLSRDLLLAGDVTDTCLAASRGLDRWSDDIRAADIYLRVGDDLALVATTRRTEAAPIAPEVLAAAVAGEKVVIGQEVRPFGPAAHVVVPIGRAEDGGARGVLVTSLQPEIALNAGTWMFLDFVAGQIGVSLDAAVARDRELGESRAINETLQAAMITPIVDERTVAARFVPAVGNLSVGGDWYDLLELPGNRRALVVGDCVGHGLDAATAMAQLRSAAQSMLLEGRGPASVLEGLDTFAATVEGAFCATVVCVVIDRTVGEITYSRAGHPPPLVSGPDGPRWLGPGHSLPHALVEGRERQAAPATVGPPAGGVLYSDGLVERRDESIDVGLERLARAVARRADAPVAQLADGLLHDMVGEQSRDDVVVIVKRLRATD